MPLYPDGTFVKEAQWNRLVSAIPSSYTVFKDGSTYFAEANVKGATDYEDDAGATAIQMALDNAYCRKLMLKGAITLNSKVQTLDKPRLIVGEGPRTIITPPENDYAFELSSATSDTFPGGVSDLQIDGSSVTGSKGVHLDDVHYGVLQRLIIKTQGHGVTIGGGTSSSSYNTRLSDCHVEASGNNSAAYLVSPDSTKVCADTWFRECVANASDYGFKLTEGANGAHFMGCGVLGADVAGYYVEGAYSGCYFDTSFADQCAGDGFYITDTANQPSAVVTLDSCWASSCNHGLYVKGQNATKGVYDLTVDKGYYGVNGLTGIRLEGYVTDAIIDHSFIRDNNVDNVSTINATNLLIYNDPQHVDVRNSHFGWIYTNPTNRTYAVRLHIDTSANRDVIVRFAGNTLRDANDTSKAKLGLKNTSATYSIVLMQESNRAVDLTPTATVDVTEGGSTGTITLQDFSAWCRSFTSLPGAGVAYEGMILYLREGGGTRSKAYMCMKTSADAYEWTRIGETEKLTDLDVDTAYKVDGATVLTGAYADVSTEYKIAGTSRLAADYANVTAGYKVSDTQVVGAQGAAITDTGGGAGGDNDGTARVAIDLILARLRAHGLIAT